MDLLCACTMVLLNNVLEFRTYQPPNDVPHEEADLPDCLLDHDINNILYYERADICYAHGVALRIFRWIRQCAIVRDPSGRTVEDLCSLFFVQIVSSLLSYGEAASASDLGTTSSFTAHLPNQIYNIVNLDVKIAKTWRDREKLSIPSQSLALENWEQYTVQWDSSVRFDSMPSSPLMCRSPFPCWYAHANLLTRLRQQRDDRL